MSLAVRFISTYLNWEILPEDKSWLQEDEIPADPLSDLHTKNNTLSIFLIDENKTDLERCIAAYATCKSRGELREIDYLIFDEKLIKEVGITYRQQDDNNIIDEKIRKSHWNLYEVSSQKLVALANKVIVANNVDTLSIDQVCNLINDSISKGWINKQEINKGVGKVMKKYC